MIPQKRPQQNTTNWQHHQTIQQKTAHWVSTEQGFMQRSIARQGCIVSHLGSNAYAPWMLVIQQQPFRPEPGVIWVVTLCCHVCGVAHHVQWDYVQQGMTGRMETISERQAGVLDTLACCPWNPDIRSLDHSNFPLCETMPLVWCGVMALVWCGMMGGIEAIAKRQASVSDRLTCCPLVLRCMQPG